MSFDARKNFAYSTIATAPSPAASGTTFNVQSGDETLFPTPPFNGVAWPSGLSPLYTNAEIVRVTAIDPTTHVFTITRAQEDTSAKNIATGWQFMAGLTNKTLADIEALFPIDLTTNVTGQLPVANGGTASSTASGARTNLGLGSIATKAATGWATLTVAGSAPGSPASGDIWFDTSATTSVVALTGITAMFAGSTAPTGWLICDGSAVSRTTYANLFAVIGTLWGAGDGSTTFNLPDMRQRFPLGRAASGTGSTLGSTGGNIDHAHTLSDAGAAEIFQTATTLYSRRVGSMPTWTPGFGLSGTNNTSFTSQTVGAALTGSTDAANPPFAAINFIIKT